MASRWCTHLCIIILGGKAAEKPGCQPRLRHHGALAGGTADGSPPVGGAGAGGGGQREGVRRLSVT